MNKLVNLSTSVCLAAVSSHLPVTRGGNSWYYENYKDLTQDAYYLDRDPDIIITGIISTP